MTGHQRSCNVYDCGKNWAHLQAPMHLLCREEQLEQMCQRGKEERTKIGVWGVPGAL